MCQVFYAAAMTQEQERPRGSRDIWLKAAYELLISDGIEAVKVMALARRLNLTRTGFYWFFKDIAELQREMVAVWESQNTDRLLAHCEKPADTICAALFHLMDCWLNPALFDAPLDLAIRNWARNDAGLQARVSEADRRRIEGVAGIFLHHGFSEAQAEVRGMTVIYTQIGYISMQVQEARAERHARVQQYVELFAGQRPTEREVQAFLARQPQG